MKYKFLFTGIANSGKTTLYNGITKSSERVGNWYGVTTQKKSKVCKISNKNVEICDFPGSYFDDDYTLEQAIIKREIKDAYGIIVVCEAVNLKKSLEFINRASVFNKNISLVINMYGELKSNGGSIDIEALKKKTGLNIIVAEVINKSGVNAVKEAIATLIDNNKYNNVIKFPIKSQQICNKVLKIPENKEISWQDKIFLQNKFGFIYFLALFIVVLYLAFGKYSIGSFFSWLTENMFIYAVNQPIERLIDYFNGSLFIKNFVINGIFAPILEIVVFLPKIAILHLFNAYVDESGILARIAYKSDFLFKKAGLTGRAVFTFLSSYGCTASGVLCCDGLEKACIKKRAIFSICQIPCSAMTPVLLYLFAFISKRYGFIFILLLYVICFFFSLFAGFLYTKFSKNKDCTANLIIEFPPYRKPHLLMLIKSLQKFLKSFIIKIGIVVMFTTSFLWILSSVTPQLEFVKTGSANSIISVFARKITFLFIPCGIRDWRLVVSLITGLIAKESVISSLTLFNYVFLSKKSLVSFIVFFIFYPPCITAMSAIKNKTNLKTACKVFVTYFLIGYFLSMAVNYWKISLPVFTFLIVLMALKKIITSKKSKGKTNGKIYCPKRDETI